MRVGRGQAFVYGKVELRQEVRTKFPKRMRWQRSPQGHFTFKGKKFKWKSLSRIRRQRYFFCFSRRSCQVKFEVVVFLFGCGDARFGKLRFNEDFGKKL